MILVRVRAYISDDIGRQLETVRNDHRFENLKKQDLDMRYRCLSYIKVPKLSLYKGKRIIFAAHKIGVFLPPIPDICEI
jgi:hypothetical protein